LEAFIITVIRAFSWTPKYVTEELYVDKKDHFGLEFWYLDIEAQHKEITNK
jgi:hypothetical protein